ncbi:uncharacterized protein BDV14DRAFT_147573 [Aspergillus stella-maris]|uniref:uncharacterized protein n=1 Tax=Aspergillus stella-maris TaxID=1810926 RepID=UPI003CCD3F17
MARSSPYLHTSFCITFSTFLSSPIRRLRLVLDVSYPITFVFLYLYFFLVDHYHTNGQTSK